MIWRIYRLPGSREWWLIDCGPGTTVFQVKTWDKVEVQPREINNGTQPRAWLEVQGNLFIKANHAIFYPLGFRRPEVPCAQKAV